MRPTRGKAGPRLAKKPQPSKIGRSTSQSAKRVVPKPNAKSRTKSAKKITFSWPKLFSLPTFPQLQKNPTPKKPTPKKPMPRVIKKTQTMAPRHLPSEDESTKTAQNRLHFLTSIFLMVFVILAIRAVDLTVFQHDTLKKIAQRQHRKRVVAPAHRGKILDRKGQTLAVSLPVKSLSVDIDQVKDPNRLANQLAPLTGVDKKQLLKRLSARAGSFPVLKRKLPPVAIRKIESLRNPALFFMPETQRFYPMGEITSHLLGFVSFSGVGREGLERSLEKDLKGFAGERIITRDRLGRPMPMAQTITPAHPGSDVTLTIDTNIQYIAYRSLLKGVQQSRAKAGTVVIMNPNNGDILALVNQPGFNPNNLGQSAAGGRRNRAITDAFEPGSTFKVFTIAAALDLNKITPDTLFNIEGGKFRVEDRTIRDFHRGKTWVTVSHILAQSSNVGAAKIGLLLGNDLLENYIYGFGFGRPTDIGLRNESGGRIPDISQYRQVGVANRSYGYGITATHLQLTTAISAAINGGLLYRPHLVSGKTVNGQRVPTQRPDPERVIKPETSKMLRTILTKVVGPEGTAPNAQVDGYSVAGKTGTARKARGKLGYVKGLYFSSFVGFVPAKKPELVIFVGIDEPQGRYYGGQVAAPVFREIAQEILPLLSIFPETRNDPSLPPMVEIPTQEPTTLINLSLSKAMEILKKDGIIPSVSGSGLVEKVEKLKDGQIRLLLK